MADEQKVDVREGVVVRPGDTLVLRVDPDTCTADELTAFRDALERRLGEDIRVFVAAFSGELGVVQAYADDDPRVWPGVDRG